MQIDMEEVPIGIRRRVAQLLENTRKSGMDPTGGRASLSGEVTAFYRPDLDGIAYYEFAVDLGRGGDGVVAVSGRGEKLGRMRLPARTGFIIAAAGEHDHPIAHWSLDREPPSRQLAETAGEKGAKIARIFKLDALAYAGESPDGELAAQTGQLPLPIEGLPDNPDKARGRITSVMARPAQASKNDDEVGDGRHELVRRGARPAKVKFAEVRNWKELRTAYAGSFAPLLRNLADSAARGWRIERLVEKFGEGVMAGSSRRVALLEGDAMVEVSGPGAKFVKAEPLEPVGKGGAVALHVEAADLPQEIPFELNIAYGSGGQETLRFFAVSPKTPSERRDGGSLDAFEEE